MTSLRRGDAAFSFVELLVVLLIGSALYAVALGPVRSYLDGKKRAGCAENLRKLHMVMVLYANEHSGAFPNSAEARYSDDAFALLVPKCTSDPSVFACPVSEMKIHYAYAMGLSKEDIAPLVADAAASHPKGPGNIIFTDGHVETFEPGAPRFPALPPHGHVLEPRP